MHNMKTTRLYFDNLGGDSDFENSVTIYTFSVCKTKQEGGIPSCQITKVHTKLIN